MKGIREMLQSAPVPDKKRTGPNSRFATIIEDIMRFMGEDPMNGRRFKYWCGRTSGISYDTMYRLLSEAKTGTNPRALFQFLLKKEKTTKQP